MAISDDPAIAEFFNGWEVYRAVIDNDCMEHREVFADVAGELSSRDRPFTVLDLGCGDAAGIAPVLRALPLARYVGVDVAQQALDFAAGTLGDLADRTEFRCDDLMAQLRDDSATYDVILLSFALHHFPGGAKRDVLALARQRLAPGGQVVLIDVVRRDGETREEYLERYADHVATWPLSPDIQDRIMTHVRRNDWPEEVSVMPEVAHEAGFPDVREFYRGGNETQAAWSLTC